MKRNKVLAVGMMMLGSGSYKHALTVAICRVLPSHSRVSCQGFRIDCFGVVLC
jgi:hypothetical protein